MDEETRAALRLLGWEQVLGRDASGRPYTAFMRGGDYFHVTADSRCSLVDSAVEYAPGRRAKTVTRRPRREGSTAS